MRRYKVFLFATLVCLGARGAFAFEFAAETASFSGGTDHYGKIYVSGNKVRIESGGAVSIVRGDKGVTWALMPEQRAYLERPVDARLAAGTSEKVPGELEREVLGNETLNGRSAAKYRVVYDDRGMSRAVELWSDAGTSLPVKVSAEDGGWTVEYRDPVTGPQDPALFEVPKGYKRFEEKSR